jgi:hypothetical protein
MAASVRIYELTASMAGVNKTGGTIRFKLADDQTVDSNNPITIQTSGTRRSYTKQIRMYCATPPNTNISNMKVYTDGALFTTGVTVNATNVNGAFSANATAAMPGTNFQTFTSVSPKLLNVYHSTAVTATGFFGDILKLQLNASSGASSGTLSAETITFSYDEI